MWRERLAGLSTHTTFHVSGPRGHVDAVKNPIAVKEPQKMLALVTLSVGFSMHPRVLSSHRVTVCTRMQGMLLLLCV